MTEATLSGRLRHFWTRAAGSLGPIDAVTAALLLVASVPARARLPPDGWFFDDAWQAVAASHAAEAPRATGQTQPLYNALLWGWTRVAGESDLAFALPAIVAGVLAAPLLFLALRRMGHVWAGAAIVSAALAGVGIHARFSSRVKVYAIEVLVVVVLGLAVPWLARRRWRWPLTLAWSAIGIVASVFSSFTFLAVLVAGVVLVLHACGDRLMRFGALVVQAVVGGAMTMLSQRMLDMDTVNSVWEGSGGFVSLRPDEVGGDLLDRLPRLAMLVVEGPDFVLYVVALVALVGLVVGAWRGDDVLRHRFFLGTIVAGLVGSMAGRVPFVATGGPDTLRVSLWLAPAVAFGLSSAITWGWRRLPESAPVRSGVGAVAVVVVAALMLSAGTREVHYAGPGARQAIEHSVAVRQPGDVVWVTRDAMYPFALYSGLDSGVDPRPGDGVGFRPDLDDQDVFALPFGRIGPEALTAAQGSDRVLVVSTSYFPTGVWGEQKRDVAVALALLGFRPTDRRTIGTGLVTVWDRA